MRNLGRRARGLRLNGLRLNVFQRIAAGYGFILLILLATGLLAFVIADQSSARFRDFASREVPALITVNNLSIDIYQEELPLKAYGDSPLLGRAREDLLKPYLQATATIDAELATLNTFAIGKPELTKPLAALTSAIEAREMSANADVLLLRNGAPRSVLSDDDRPIRAVQQADDALAASIASDIRKVTAAADLNARTAQARFTLVFILGAFLTIMAGLSSARSISRPLALLTNGAERIAAGDPIDPPRLDRRDEIGHLSTAVNRMVGSLREVTEHERALVGQYKQVQEELQRSNAELEQFAYIASHDLQEPLRMVGSYTSLLKRRYAGKLDADADEFMTFAMEGVARMRSLINDLLTYSRVGKEDRTSVPTASRAALDRALANLQVAIAERGAAVIIGELPTVMASLPQLTQIFQNLIGNGLKFCKEAQPEIRVNAERSGDDWILSVRDNGIGIPAEYRDRIFLIFQRLHKREEYEGTGIGLAICKKIVEQHGGRIWVESESGKGATFRFMLHGVQELALAA